MKLQQASNIQYWVSTPPTRDKSFIADIDLVDYCPEFWRKCYDVLSNNKYTYLQKSFVKSIMGFFDDWSYITWKQYDSVMGLFIHTKITKEYIVSENRKYVAKRSCTLYDSGQLIFLGGGNGLGNCFSQTFNDHVLPFIDEDDLIGRYLPTDESLSDLTLSAFSSGYEDYHFRKFFN